MEKMYKVIKPYFSVSAGITLPVGTIVHWWNERGFYVAEAVNNICAAIPKWTVEAWHDYFEPLPPAE